MKLFNILKNMNVPGVFLELCSGFNNNTAFNSNWKRADPCQAYHIDGSKDNEYLIIWYCAHLWLIITQ